jgi:chromosomal replication initiation ATPase DnaA
MQDLAPDEVRIIQLATRRVASVSASKGWEAALEQLSNRFPGQFAAWLAPLTAQESAGTVRISAKSVFAADYIKTHFGPDIADAVRAAYGAETRVEIAGPRHEGFG